MTVTTSAKFIPEIWSMDVLKAAEAALVISPLVKHFDSMVKKAGDVLHIPKLSNLSANNKVANTDVTKQTVTEDEVLLNINLHKETSFEIEDIVTAQSNYDLRALYTQKAGYAQSQAIDTSLATLAEGFSGIVGSAGAALTDATIVAAIQHLDEANAPLEDRALVLKPSGKADIMKLDKFVSATYLGRFNESSPVVKGPNSRFLWGEIYGVPVYYTTQVTTTAGSPATKNNFLMHKEALAIAVQQAPRVQVAYWLPSLAYKVVCDTIYGVVELRDDYGVLIKS